MAKTFILDDLHNPKAETVVTEKTESFQTVPEEKKKTTRKKAAKNRIRTTLFIDQKYFDWIDIGTLEEKFRSKSDFVEHILEQYFKDKNYL